MAEHERPLLKEDFAKLEGASRSFDSPILRPRLANAEAEACARGLAAADRRRTKVALRKLRRRIGGHVRSRPHPPSLRGWSRRRLKHARAMPQLPREENAIGAHAAERCLARRSQDL